MSCRLCSLLLLLLGLWLPAQGRHLTGRVVDDRSGEELPGVTVELLRLADSTLVRSAVTGERTVFGWKTVGYDIDVDNNTAYLLRFSMVGYRTLYRRVDVKMAERVNEQYVDEVRLEEEARLPLTASVSNKPLLWLLWLGAAFTFFGTSCALRRRC